MTLVRQTVYLLLTAMLLAFLQGLTLDRAVWSGEEPGSISLSEGLELADAIWVDARSREAYDIRHLPGALHLSEDDWERGLGEILSVWEPDQAIIVYCDGGGCDSSRVVSARLRKELGMEQIFWLRGGWDAVAGEGDGQ